MAERLRVLLSAYACEPGKGSEPEVGWQWAMHLAQGHTVTVLTRANNRAAIEQELRARPAGQPAPRFVYHDLGAGWRALKRGPGGMAVYYAAWQRRARAVIAGLAPRDSFDVLHHLTFVSFRFPAAVAGHGVPTVWGPVGGIESYPWPLLRGAPWRAASGEAARNLANRWAGCAASGLAARAAQFDVVLAATPAMQVTLARLGAPSHAQPAIGIELLPAPSRAPRAGPLRLLYVGALKLWKGVDLILEALAATGISATLTLIGDGPERRWLERRATDLRLAGRVEFRGRLPRAEALAAYARHDLFCHPSLHDSGAFTVIEAMARGLPVLCVAAGGPWWAVGAGGGRCAPVGSRGEMVAALAGWLRGYDADRELLTRDGQIAHRLVMEQYAWPRQAERMTQFYTEALGRRAVAS